MLSVKEALDQILAKFQPLESTLIPLHEAPGRILAKPVRAEIDLPSFDNSSVDGFAVRANDVKSANNDSPKLLNVIGDIPAGTRIEYPIHEDECMRIMTGAPIPAGADAIVMVEDTDFNYRDTAKPAPPHVAIRKSVEVNENIRRQGADILAGQNVLPLHQKLRAQDIGLLAMLGISEVNVIRRPRVAILSGGDELINVSENLVTGKVRDANSYSLSALAKESGAEVLHLGIAKDNPNSIKRLLDQAVDGKVDLIISSAGVSVGAFDFVRDVVQSMGSLDFWKVNMRPGKPLAFGHYQDVPFFGLPGNPVSAFVGFLVFIIPTLEKLSGIESNLRSISRVRLAEEITSDGRESYLRAIVTSENGTLTARLTGHQASSNMLSLVRANALLIIPSGVKSVPLGQEVNAWLLRGL
jgi:molybdopterin molybdotransferase